MSFADTKQRVYLYLVNHAEESPSVREICAALGIGSTSTVFRALHALVEDGRVGMKDGRRRNVSIPTKTCSVKVPVLGSWTEDVPILAQESLETFITYSSPYPVSGELFAIHVKGDGMAEAGILDGDMVIVRKTEDAEDGEDGEIVVALVEGETTVQRFHREEGSIILGKVIADYRFYE